MISWNRPFFFKTASLLCIFLLVFHLTSLRPKGSIRTSQNASIILSDLLFRQATNSTHQNLSEPITSDDSRKAVKCCKKAVQNDSIGLLTINSTHAISQFQAKNGNFTSANKTHKMKINEIDDNTIYDRSTQTMEVITDDTKLQPCPFRPANLNGPIDVDIEYESLASVEQRFCNRLEPGGYYKPADCMPNDRVAIVIPYRDRVTHLAIFLKNIHPFLMKQQANYGVFIVEQFGNGLFNRAALMNVGFLEARKLSHWNCFIFHDVDLIPLDDRNLYRCPKQPRHMSVAIDTMNFKLPYSSIFGGVSAMTVKQFQSVNGFSNAFFGWGGEDDDMSNRLKHVGYHISRYPTNIARYKMLYHRKEKANPKRFENLESGAKKFDSEGLNSLKYKIRALKLKVLYTWILAEIETLPTV